MQLENKILWDLNITETKYAYENIHMNNYVYVALMLYHNSAIPLNKFLKLNRNTPTYLYNFASKLLELSPYINNYSPEIVRANYLFRSYFLFSQLDNVKTLDLHKVIDLLSILSYISILSDKNDNILLWPYLIIRPYTKHIENTFNKITEKINIETFIPKIDKINNHEILLVKFVHTAVSTLITMSENKFNSTLISDAFINVEKNMFRLEREFKIVKNDNIKESFSTPTQQRWRNTLYLYGGRYFEIIKNYDKAYEWYTKGIAKIDLHKTFNYYLTDFKTTERLLSAYRVGKYINKDLLLLKDLIDNCIVKAFHNTANYAKKIIKFINDNPNVKLTRKNLENDKIKLQYSGESVREVFLIALLYNHIINDLDFKNINYQEYLENVD